MLQRPLGCTHTRWSVLCPSMLDSVQIVWPSVNPTYQIHSTLPWHWHSWRRCSLLQYGCSCTSASAHTRRSMPHPPHAVSTKIHFKNPRVGSCWIWTECLHKSHKVSKVAIILFQTNDFIASSNHVKCECRHKRKTTGPICERELENISSTTGTTGSSS